MEIIVPIILYFQVHFYYFFVLSLKPKTRIKFSASVVTRNIFAVNIYNRIFLHVIPPLKYHFTCSELDPYQHVGKSQNIMPRTVDDIDISEVTTFFTTDKLQVVKKSIRKKENQEGLIIYT